MANISNLKVNKTTDFHNYYLKNLYCMWFLLLSLSLVDMIPTLSVELIYNLSKILNPLAPKKICVSLESD